jgi:hypothetical protein
MIADRTFSIHSRGSRWKPLWVGSLVSRTHLIMLRFLLVAAAAAAASARLVTIHNDEPRYDVDGALVDAHDGMILAVNGSYFLYGEFYNQTVGNYPWAGGYPKLAVYTSPDLLAWTFRAPLLIGGQEGWIPNVFYDAQRQRFVCWYGVGDWGVGASLRALRWRARRPPACLCAHARLAAPPPVSRAPPPPQPRPRTASTSPW